MKIDFYLFDTASSQKSLYFACQLLENIYTTQRQSIYVTVKTREEAERFDALLWTYRDNSFLPHNIYHTTDEYPPRIQIGLVDDPKKSGGILFNLTRDIPPFYQQFEQVIEIVFNDPLVQQLARERYKQYRDQKHEINTLKFKAYEHD
ncbi:MAG: DNA polymerase III subunit chi [Gammaproteobacteria bacterium]|nr:DNA polymerase III subunit chi [Gammaproteobacteria bacterium]MCW5583920.1 DNA polymerase III subunit chi [Gammaproteobacteria bacterium]